MTDDRQIVRSFKYDRIASEAFDLWDEAPELGLVAFHECYDDPWEVAAITRIDWNSSADRGYVALVRVLGFDEPPDQIHYHTVGMGDDQIAYRSGRALWEHQLRNRRYLGGSQRVGCAEPDCEAKHMRYADSALGGFLCADHPPVEGCWYDMEAHVRVDMDAPPMTETPTEETP